MKRIVWLNGIGRPKTLDERSYERCILCWGLTDVPKDMPIGLRDAYMEGQGQLCRSCYYKLFKESIATDKRKHRRIVWSDGRETMAKKKPYIAPKILFCDFNNGRYIGNDADKIDEINNVRHCENAIMADEFDFQALCPLNRELYCVLED